MPYKAFGKSVHKLNADGSKGELVKKHKTTKEAQAHASALNINVTAKESERLEEREFSGKRREQLADKGAAMPDGSFPIVSRQDLLNAKKRARTLGLTDLLPDDWKESAAPVSYFGEFISLKEAELDEDEFIAKGVTLIKAGFSTNRDKAGRHRYYPADVLESAAPVFEGVRAYANHPRRSDEKDMPERDVRDLTGYYENVRASDGALVADYRVVGKAQEWLWPMIVETQRKPDYVQLSINALGAQRVGEAEGRPAIIVESIIASNSVDVVTTGAAGGGFKGAILASDGGDFTAGLLAAMPFEQWREARPEFIDRLKNEWKTARDSEAVKTLREQLAKAQKKHSELAEQHRAEQDELVRLRRVELADRLLGETSLPYKLRETIRAELLDKDEDEMKAVIERESEKYRAAPKRPVEVSGAGQQPVHQPEDAQPKTPALLEAFGVSDRRFVPRDGETPEQWAARIQQLRG